MDNYGEILRYMGHSGEADSRLEELIKSSLEKLKLVCEKRHVIIQLPCIVEGSIVSLGELSIQSRDLAANLGGSKQVHIFAATLGAGVDRLLAQRSKMDSAEALCLQACGAAEIEALCDKIEGDLKSSLEAQGLCTRPRFSPGFGDFSISHQTELLSLLEAPKRIGLGETETHMLIPLKSVTALIGAERSTGKEAS